MTKQPTTLEVENIDKAHFECVFPSCGGICCKNGRPGVEPGELARIKRNLKKFLVHLTPHAKRVVETRGFVTKRIKDGNPMLAVSEGWCVFFNEGCVLHKVGATEGNRWKYKPWHCVVFPLAQRAKGKWFVRQWKHRGEAWDLFCLNPKESPLPAKLGVAGELEFVKDFENGAEEWRDGAAPKS